MAGIMGISTAGAPGTIGPSACERPPDPGIGPRADVLYLAHRFPYPPDKGDRIRTYHLLRSLSELADVHLACFADESFGRSDLDELGRLCRRVAVIRLGNRSRRIRAFCSLASGRTATEGAFGSPAMRTLIGRWTRETRFHSAIASASSMVQYLGAREARQIPAVVDLVDVDSRKWLDYAGATRGPMAWLYRTEGRRLGDLERSIPIWARAVTLVSEAEAALFRRSGGSGPIHAVTNGVDFDSFHPGIPGSGDRGGCVFVGALDYRPNVDGVVWFCREVWPEILSRRPGTRFALVGRKPSAAVRRLAGLPGVDLVGQVHDVRPHLASASVAVMPLRIARGVQNKVLEALAMGKAVVASPEAIEGIRAEPGVHLLAASAPAEWVEAVTRLLDDGDLRQRLGADGRAYVEEAHSWERCLAPFGTLLGLDPVDPGSSVLAPRVGAVEAEE
jgi:sugar transferase (PEP-CTERM/EpsH1 system associated)